MFTTLTLCAALATAPIGDAIPDTGVVAEPSLRVTASLTAPTLVVGQQYEAVLRMELGDGWSASQAGIPSAILQIDAPASIDLVGKKLTTYDQLKRNEFLEEPWERLMDSNEQRVRFTLLSEPAEGETIGLNVVAYLASTQPREDDSEPELVFVRRRVDLPIAPGAKAETATASRRSDWGVNGTLQIGDKAEAFELPRADGSTL
ncbi:MAG: hypothetical protein ACYTCU_09130, partial [Planctomycetota bacterium]